MTISLIGEHPPVLCIDVDTSASERSAALAAAQFLVTDSIRIDSLPTDEAARIPLATDVTMHAARMMLSSAHIELA